MTTKKESSITSTCHKRGDGKSKTKDKDSHKRKSEEGKPPREGMDNDGNFAKGNKFSVGNGRPPIFKTADELAIKIDCYIDNCPDTKACYTSEGTEYEIKIPTISGMAYFLGFESRQSMYDYKNKEGRFSYIIKRAMFYMETHYEQIMQGKAPTGAIFALKNMGWRDKTEVDNTHKFTGQAPINFGDTSKAKK